jgi:acetolactate synthase-1/2/3 large subunit
MNGAQLLAKAIERQGVKTVFGLAGHLDFFFGALQDIGIRLIDHRHEAAVVLAADGYARVSRKLSVAVVTAGPGLANAFAGITTAYETCTPMLVICGRNTLRTLDIGSYQELDHTHVVAPITKWARTVHDASRLGEYVDTACRIALSGRPGPVLLEIPSNLILQQVNETVAQESLRPVVRGSRVVPEASAIQRAVDAIASASRPFILAGDGAYWGDAGAGLHRLSHEAGLPVLARGLARGLVPEDMVHAFPWPLAMSVIRDADLVVVVGTRMNAPVAFGAPPWFGENTRFVQIDVDGSQIGLNRYVEAPIVGDAGLTTEALAAGLAERGYCNENAGKWISDGLQARINRVNEIGHGETGMVHPLRVARELAPRLPADAIIVADGANCLNWFKAILTVQQAPGWLDHEPFGSMGIGTPMALGAVAAEQDRTAGTGEAPRPVFLITGDGSLGFYAMEFASASHNGLPFLGIVSNDGGWGANRNSQRRRLGRNYGMDFNQSRYDLLAQALECHGEIASTPPEVGPAIDRAMEAVRKGQPALINVVVDPESGTVRGEDPLLQMVAFNNDWPRTGPQAG